MNLIQNPDFRRFAAGATLAFAGTMALNACSGPAADTVKPTSSSSSTAETTGETTDDTQVESSEYPSPNTTTAGPIESVEPRPDYVPEDEAAAERSEQDIETIDEIRESVVAETDDALESGDVHYRRVGKKGTYRWLVMDYSDTASAVGAYYNYVAGERPEPGDITGDFMFGKFMTSTERQKYLNGDKDADKSSVTIQVDDLETRVTVDDDKGNMYLDDAESTDVPHADNLESAGKSARYTEEDSENIRKIDAFADSIIN